MTESPIYPDQCWQCKYYEMIRGISLMGDRSYVKWECCLPEFPASDSRSCQQFRPCGGFARFWRRVRGTEQRASFNG